MMSNKRGRPPREPYESLRTRMYMATLAKFAGVEFSAAALRKHFEAKRCAANADGLPKRIRRWEGWCRGTHSPSPRWRQWIESHFTAEQKQYLVALYSLPLWDALGNKVTDEEWIKLASRLPAELSKRLLSDGPSGQQLKKKHPRLDCTISAVKRWGNLTAVTALIILMRSGAVPNPSADYFSLYRALTDTLAIAIVSRSHIGFSQDIKWLLAKTVNMPAPIHHAIKAYSANETEFFDLVNQLINSHTDRLSSLEYLEMTSCPTEYPELLHILHGLPTIRREDGSLSRYAKRKIKVIEEKVKLFQEKRDSPPHRFRKSFL